MEVGRKWELWALNYSKNELNQQLRNVCFRVGFYAIQYMHSQDCEVACNSVQRQLRKIQSLVWESTYRMDVEPNTSQDSASCELVCWHEFLWNIFKYFNVLRCRLFYIGMPYSMWCVLPRTRSNACDSSLGEATKDLMASVSRQLTSAIGYLANRGFLARNYPAKYHGLWHSPPRMKLSVVTKCGKINLWF